MVVTSGTLSSFAASVQSMVWLRLATGLLALGSIVGIAGCGSPLTVASTSPQATASGIPAGPPILGIDWGRAAAVERPEQGFAVPSPGTSFGNTDGSNRLGHPLHFYGQAIMADVAKLPSGGLVSVGYVFPGWHPTAWTSADAQTWAIQAMGTTDFTFPVAMAVGSDGGVVAVGRSGSAPLAWTSSDGRSWQSHPVAILGDGRVAERMTTVIATRDGYLAGGSLGPELSDRHARFWRSTNGTTWTPVTDDPHAFANAEVRAIASFGAGYVAVGSLGSVQRIAGSVAWTSTDGLTWTRIDDPALQTGRAVALVEAPFRGLVAVGSDLIGHEAFAWVSPDGRSWSLAPSEPSRQFNGSILMTDVTVVGDELIAIGKYAPLQRSTAISWVSSDGLRWEQARSAAVQEQAEFLAIVPAGPGVVAVGSFGGPDDALPTVWLSPGH
jgi:hypothetical protein